MRRLQKVVKHTWRGECVKRTCQCNDALRIQFVVFLPQPPFLTVCKLFCWKVRARFPWTLPPRPTIAYSHLLKIANIGSWEFHFQNVRVNVLIQIKSTRAFFIPPPGSYNQWNSPLWVSVVVEWGLRLGSCTAITSLCCYLRTVNKGSSYLRVRDECSINKEILSLIGPCHRRGPFPDRSRGLSSTGALSSDLLRFFFSQLVFRVLMVSAQLWARARDEREALLDLRVALFGAAAACGGWPSVALPEAARIVAEASISTPSFTFLIAVSTQPATQGFGWYAYHLTVLSNRMVQYSL